MADRAGEPPGAAAAQQAFFVLGSAALVVLALYLGERIFVPLALALLLTLLLGPVLTFMERRGLRRFPAVLSTACLAFLVIGLVGWAVVAQAAGLVEDLPRHKADVRDKIAQLQGSGNPGPLAAVRDMVEGLDAAAADTAGPVVHLEPAKPSLLSQVQGVAGRILGNVSLALAVVLLVVTLLLYREDTRNRVIRLAGRGRLTVTTRALDEAGRRIGGYLLGHSAVNAGFGTVVTLGLFLLGVPYPALWGLLAGTFRFVPSVGVWLVAPLPAALAFVSEPGLVTPAVVLVLFLVLELLTTNLVEPRVCGRSIGLAPVPLLLAVTFWTGLWGVVGLVLATPLTVCLAVLGKHVRQLGFLSVLLSREAALRPAARYYQRLLARDRPEAEAVAREYLADHPVEDLFDRVLIPALVLVRRGRAAGDLQPEDEEFILRTTRAIVDSLEHSADGVGKPTDRVLVLGVPAADGVDEVGLAMLSHLCRRAGTEVRVATRLPAVGDGDAAPAAVLIASVGPGGLTEARYLCRRLRDQHPGVKIVVGRWGRGKDSRKVQALLPAGADKIAVTHRAARPPLEGSPAQHHTSMTWRPPPVEVPVRNEPLGPELTGKNLSVIAFTPQPLAGGVSSRVWPVQARLRPATDTGLRPRKRPGVIALTWRPTAGPTGRTSEGSMRRIWRPASRLSEV